MAFREWQLSYYEHTKEQKNDTEVIVILPSYTS